MPKQSKVFVLVDDRQMPVSPKDVLEIVQLDGFAKAADQYGYSESHLRAFLKRNGVVSKRTVVYEQTAPISMEEKLEFTGGG